MVGEPGRKYLWILSRTPKMDDGIYAEVVSRLAAKGYDAAKLELTHPLTGKPLKLEAPLPPELNAFLDRLESA